MIFRFLYFENLYYEGKIYEYKISLFCIVYFNETQNIVFLKVNYVATLDFILEML